MRIAIDLLPLQSAASRGRGVGRYVAGLTAALADPSASHDLVLLVHQDLLWPAIPSAVVDRCEVHCVPPPPRVDVHGAHPEVQALINANRLRLDAYLHPNPFEPCPGYDLPSRPLGGPTMAALVHDLIPLHDQERYFANPDDGEWFSSRLRKIARYDLICANSEATRSDCIAHRVLPADRVVTVGAGVDLARFAAASTDDEVLARLGIDRPFLLHLGGADERKNLRGQIEAWRRSDQSRRSDRLLVVAGNVGERPTTDESVRWLGPVTDPELGALYRRCIALLHVSRSEGFGLPIVEALACGAAVIVGDDPAQREAVGELGMVVPADDPAAIARAIDRIAKHRPAATPLGPTFRWGDVAARMVEAIDRSMPRTSSRTRVGARLLAMFSPLPPKPSGIADDTLRLARHLTEFDRIDLFHDEDYVPDLRDRGGRLATHDHRMYARRDSAIHYDGLVHQMGNSWFHRAVYESLVERPGITVLHDPSLAGFHAWYASTRPEADDWFRRELEHDDPTAFRDHHDGVSDWSREEGGIQGAAARRGVSMNRRVIERSRHVIVHSAWCRDEIAGRLPHLAHRLSVVPLGAEPVDDDPTARPRALARLGLDSDALLIGCFGILTRNKLNDEVIEAFAQVVGRLPSACLLFAGQDWEQGAARLRADQLGLGNRVRFLGRVDESEYLDWLRSVDLVVSLRRPPTFGESSASLLDSLRCGRPTIVNDVGTALDLPPTIVERIRWDAKAIDRLAAAMLRLATDAAGRRALGNDAREYVRIHHAWSRVAAQYTRIIREYGGRTSAPFIHHAA